MQPQAFSRRGALALLATGALAWMAVTLAPSQAHAADDVTVVIRTIHAAPDGQGADPQLNDLGPKLTKAFQGYGAFTQIQSQRVNISAAEPFSIVLPDGTRFRLDYKGAEGDGALHRLGVGVGKRLDTDVRASNGSTFFQAGLPYKHNGQDGILIVAISLL